MIVTVVAEQSCKSWSQFQRKRQKISWVDRLRKHFGGYCRSLRFHPVLSRRSVPVAVIYCCIIGEKQPWRRDPRWNQTVNRYLLLRYIFLLSALLWTHSNSPGPQFLLCYNSPLTGILWDLNALHECSFGQWASFCTLRWKEKNIQPAAKKIYPMWSVISTQFCDFWPSWSVPTSLQQYSCTADRNLFLTYLVRNPKTAQDVAW